MDYLKQAHGVSLRRACRIAGISDSVYRYRPDTSRDEPVIAALQSATERYPDYGFSKLFKVLQRWGHGWNHKRVHRLYCALNLNKRRRGKKRLPTLNPEPLSVPVTVNRCWSMDFMSDSLFCGCRFRTFNVVDDFNREVLAIEVDLNLPAPRVIRVLERIIAWRGYRPNYAWITAQNSSRLPWQIGLSNTVSSWSLSSRTHQPRTRMLSASIGLTGTRS